MDAALALPLALAALWLCLVAAIVWRWHRTERRRADTFLQHEDHWGAL